MNDSLSKPPSMGGFFTLAFRPSKCARSPFPEDEENDPEYIRQTCPSSNDIPKDSPKNEREYLREVTTTAVLPPTRPYTSSIDISTLRFPTMLLQKAKRRGLPIHKQFIHPGFFARHLDQQHPNLDFTIADYKEAWYYAVGLAHKNVDLSHLTFLHPDVVKKRIGEEVQAAHDLIDRFRLKTRDEYVASRQGASVLWANADSQRLHEILAEKRERKRQYRVAKLEDDMEMMDVEQSDAVMEGPGQQMTGMFDIGFMPIRSK